MKHAENYFFLDVKIAAWKPSRKWLKNIIIRVTEIVYELQWSQCAHLKRQSTAVRLHGAVSQKTAIFIVATSHLQMKCLETAVHLWLLCEGLQK